MLARLTSGNRLTLPGAAVAAVGETEYFDVTEDAGRLVLTPTRMNRADAVRDKLAALGVTETDAADAVAWARRTG